VRNAREWLRGLAQSNVFLHQVPIGNLQTLGDPLFPPTIEPVARTRPALQTRREPERLPLEKVLGLLVVCIFFDSKVEAQPA
jgi:hypothetical protein